ncbi:MAG: hypothetical protein AAF702_23985 [Chloroflexota bacterium]
MSAQLNHIPTKLKETPPPSAGGLAFPALIQLYDTMVAQDARIVFDSTRPLADEFWNLIDGQRSLAEIGELIALQFDFTLTPETFLPFADEMADAGLIALE